MSFKCSQLVTSLDAVGGEIPAVDGKNLVKIFGLSHCDERSVRQIHRMVCILLHQL